MVFIAHASLPITAELDPTNSCQALSSSCRSVTNHAPLARQALHMSMLRYIELKSGFGDSGPAWIGRVTLSRSKTTVYFNGRALKRAKGSGVSGNHFDLETGEEFWISGVKKNGEDRHWAGSGTVLVESGAVAEYLALRNIEALDCSRYRVTESIILFSSVESSKTGTT